MGLSVNSGDEPIQKYLENALNNRFCPYYLGLGTNFTGSADNRFLFPFVLAKDFTVAKISTQCISATTATAFKIGVYESDSLGNPVGDAIIQSDNLTVSAGSKTFTLLSPVILKKNTTYLMCMQSNGSHVVYGTNATSFYGVSVQALNGIIYKNIAFGSFTSFVPDAFTNFASRPLIYFEK
jgi:hypothetical protein